MTTIKLQLPTLQNWSCHNCGGCCRQHLIEITESERKTLDQQNWSADQDIGSQPVYEWHSGPFWKKRYRLTHQADGSCVFLTAEGLCRIHAKFGELAKPLPCRIYPFAFHPAGGKFTVSLRYSCPSVVRNQGVTTASRLGELRQLASGAVPAEAKAIAAPAIVRAGASPSWATFDAFVKALAALVADKGQPLRTRLLIATRWAGYLDGIGLEKFPESDWPAAAALVMGESAKDVSQKAMAKGVQALGAVQFRQRVAQYARQDSVASLGGGWLGRWKLLSAIIRFSRGEGKTPPLHVDLPAAAFADIEQVKVQIDRETDELLTRYLLTKIEGLGFCGRGAYGWSFCEGWHAQALMIAVVLWIARWKAAGEGRQQVIFSDIQAALAIADHRHGYDSALNSGAFRNQLRSLVASGDLLSLVAIPEVAPLVRR